MDRRSFVRDGSAFAVLALGGLSASAGFGQSGAPRAGAPARFDRDWLISRARALAAEPFLERSEDLPGGLGELGYDRYHAIRFRPEARIWAGDGLRFTLDLFHRGFIFAQPVRIAIVENGLALEIAFSPADFDYGEALDPPAAVADLGFSGFRVRTRINTPDSWDEFLVFQGASYFRAVGRDQVYGISARAAAIDTAGTGGEEFPAFTAFWIEKPERAAERLIVHALLDSPSMTGAYRFGVAPGADTVIDVEATIFARREIAKLGLAPLTSMFLFDPTNRAGFDDFRPAVHDSDGLQILTGAGEWLWRPLANPADLQVSAFMDSAPRGFGLMQRKRRFDDFQDMQADYERRPSLWIEPLGEWPGGFVELVEIPALNEFNDNIVAFWRLEASVPAGGPYSYAYRMRWTDEVRPHGALLTARQTRIGLTADQDRRLFVIDFASEDRRLPSDLAMELSVSAGALGHSAIHQNLGEGSVRVTFELDTSAVELSELRLRLISGGMPASETWLYRWTAR